MKYFISDTHFGSMHAIHRENRPFKTYKAFDKFVIKTWNKQAGRGDTIYHLGDFVNCNEKDTDSWKHSLSLVKKIKADVILIIGNNEECVIKNNFNKFEDFKKYCLKLGFKDVKPNADIKIGGIDIHLTHYPSSHKDGVMSLFGHTHRITGLWKSYGLNVCCDLNYFQLHSEDSILKMFKHKEKIWDYDENVTQ